MNDKDQKDTRSSPFVFDRKRIVIIMAFIVFLNFFFFRNLGAVSFVLHHLGSFLFLTFIFKSFSDVKKDIVSVSGILAALLLFGAGILLRANVFVQSLLSFAVVFTLYVYSYVLSSGIPMVRSLFEFILAPLYFVKTYIRTFFGSIRIIASGDYKEVSSVKSKNNGGSLIQSTIIGLIIGLFVIGILISMFSSADPIFASYVKKIVSPGFMQNLLLRVVLSLVAGVVLLPFLFLKRTNIFNSPISLFKRISFTHEMSVIMTLVALVMGLFLAVQWPYVFANVPFETDLSKFGVATYSEYVQKGFLELLKVSLFVYGLIWAGLVILRENKTLGKNMLKYIQVAVLVEFFIFLFSIFRRVWLYQTYHGWSIVRIYGSFLLLWIFGITVFLALRHFWTRRWITGEMLFTTLVVFAVGVLNVESFIVNNHPPTVNRKIDYVYLSRMSADGYVGWEKAYEHSKKIIDKYDKKNGLINREERKEIAYAGIIARELLQNYRDLVKSFGTEKELKTYLEDTLDYQREANYKVYVPSVSNQQYVKTENESIDEMRRDIKEGLIDYRKAADFLTISQSTEKYEFTVMTPWNRSFYQVPYYNEYSEKRIKADANKTYSKLDRFYTWNASGITAYENMKENMSYHQLLDLQRQYFDVYQKIINQPPNERAYDMDISLKSPLLY